MHQRLVDAPSWSGPLTTRSSIRLAAPLALCPCCSFLVSLLQLRKEPPNIVRFNIIKAVALVEIALRYKVVDWRVVEAVRF